MGIEIINGENDFGFLFPARKESVDFIVVVLRWPAACCPPDELFGPVEVDDIEGAVFKFQIKYARYRLKTVLAIAVGKENGPAIEVGGNQGAGHGDVGKVKYPMSWPFS